VVLIGAGGCSLLHLTDIGALGIKGGIGLWGQPVTDAMRLEVGLFFKKRPTERCEMLGTRPRRIASSAISRWLQWLIGRSLSAGFSQVIAINAQICSGVYLAGAPERGASAIRSETDCLSAACRHRLRHRLRPHIEFPRAFAHTHTIGRMEDHAGAQRQLLRRRMGSYQLFQHFALFGQNRHRIGG
jgi:hypothetical protein